MIQVAMVRLLGQTMDNFIDYRRLENDFQHLLVGPDNDDRQGDGGDGVMQGDNVKLDIKGVKSDVKRPTMPAALEEEDMPVSIVVKADSANTLASILDALGDWSEIDEAKEGHIERPLEGQEKHRPSQRLLVSVARSGVGAITSSDVRLARDCECPVFAHSVTADAIASRELKAAGGGIVKALPEGWEGEIRGVGGQEGFIGRAGEGRECVVVSETVGELLGEIERFVMRVR